VQKRQERRGVRLGSLRGGRKKKPLGVSTRSKRSEKGKGRGEKNQFIPISFSSKRGKGVTASHLSLSFPWFEIKGGKVPPRKKGGEGRKRYSLFDKSLSQLHGEKRIGNAFQGGKKRRRKGYRRALLLKRRGKGKRGGKHDRNSILLLSTGRRSKNLKGKRGGKAFLFV